MLFRKLGRLLFTIAQLRSRRQGNPRLFAAVRAGVVALPLCLEAGDGWAAARTWDRLARPSLGGDEGALPSLEAPLPLWPTYDQLYISTTTWLWPSPTPASSSTTLGPGR